LLEFRLVATRDPALNARYGALHAQTLTRLAEFLEAFAAARGVPLGLDAHTMATALFALYTGAALEALVTSPPMAPTARAEFVRRLLHPADR
jgi:hypothetical protein